MSNWEDALADLRKRKHLGPIEEMESNLDNISGASVEVQTTIDDVSAAARNVRDDLVGFYDEVADVIAELGKEVGETETQTKQIGELQDKLEDSISADDLGELLESCGLHAPAQAGWTPDTVREAFEDLAWRVHKIKAAS